MKNIILAITVLLIFNCCKKNDDDAPTNPIDQLPLATQIGANTAGCLVDGEAFLPKGFIAAGNLRCNYIDGKDFTLVIGEKVDSKIKSISVISYNLNLSIGTKYILRENTPDSQFGEFFIFNENNEFSTTSTVTGELTITHHDFNNAILSGTFWFDAVNSNGDIVEVREGRFDMEY